MGNKAHEFQGHFRRLLLAEVVALLLSSTFLFAQDYSKAFQNLRDLGLPDVSGAEYGKVSPAEGMGYGGWDPYASFPNLRELQLSGNGWRMPKGPQSGDEKAFVVLIEQTGKVSFTSGEPDENSSATPGKWAVVPLEKDVAAILKMSGEAIPSDPFSGGGIAAQSKLLLFAAHLDAKGKKKEANQLAARLLSAAQEPETVITGAISLIATAEYEAAMKSSFQDQNWDAFADKCEELVARFGSGWTSSLPASKLAEEARKQTGTTPVFEATGTPEQAAFLKELQNAIQSFAENPSSNRDLPSTVSYSGLWILPESESRKQVLQSIEGAGKTLIELITKPEARNISIPILIAMLDDNTMLPLPKSNDNSVSNEIDLIADEERASGFSRPLTLADLAASFLVPVIPAFQPYDTSMNELKGRAHDWWAEASTSDDLNLAQTYFYSGTDTQTAGAITFLARHGSDEDRPGIEDYILEKVIDNSWQGFELAKRYLGARGEKGLPFFETLEKRVNEHIAGLEKDETDTFSNPEETFLSGLESIRSLISTDTAADILEKIASGDVEFETVQEALLSKLSQETKTEAVGALLKAATKSEEPETASLFLRTLSYLEQEEPYQLSDHAEAWLTLLDDERELQGMSFSLTAAWNAETLAAPDSQATMQSFWQTAGRHCAPFLIDRVRKRLSGTEEQELPGFPSADDVDTARREALTDSLLALEDQLPELREELESLTLAERIWAVGEPRRLGEENSDPTPPLVAAIEKAQFEVSSISAPEDWKGNLPAKGSHFQGEALTSLIQSALRQADAGKHFTITLKREAGFGPWSVTVTPFDPASLSEEDETGITNAIRNFQSRIESEVPFVSLSFGNNYYRSFWLSETTEATLNPEAAKRFENLKRNTAEMEKSMPAWFQPVTGFQRNMELTLLGTTASPKDETEN